MDQHDREKRNEGLGDPELALYNEVEGTNAAVVPTSVLGRYRRMQAPHCAMDAAEATPEKRKQAFLVLDSEEEVSVSLAKNTAELSEKFVREKGAFTAVLSGGTLIETLRYGVQSLCWLVVLRSWRFSTMENAQRTFFFVSGN